MIITLSFLIMIGCGEKQEDTSSLQETTIEDCFDGTDNDNDNLIDCEDDDCTTELDCAPQNIDNDGDGFSEIDGDCNDENNAIYPGASEIWYDGIDQNCDGISDFDKDGDGFDAVEYGGADCDDQQSIVHPNAMESCDDLDRDCDPNTTTGLSFFIQGKTAHTSLSAALNNAAHNDIIGVCPGEYSESIVHTTSKKLTIQSVDGPENTIWNFDGNGAWGFDSTKITIDGFTFKNGNGLDLSSNNNPLMVGGNLVVLNSSFVEILNSHFMGGSSVYGGGFAVLFGQTVTIQNTTISSTIESENGSVYIEDATTVTVETSSFQDNIVSGFGGGLFVNAIQTVNLHNTSFTNNESALSGGGVVALDVSLMNTSYLQVDSNQSGGNGGGFYFENVTSLQDTNSVFQNNNVDNDGGAIYTNGGSIDMIGTEILRNEARNHVGGIRVDNTTLNVPENFNATNVIFSENTADNYASLFFNLGYMNLEQTTITTSDHRSDYSVILGNTLLTSTDLVYSNNDGPLRLEYSDVEMSNTTWSQNDQALSVYDSNISNIGDQFTDNTGANLITIYNSNDITFDNCAAINNTSSYLLNSFDSVINIQNSSFTNNQNRLFHLYDQSILHVDNSSIIGNEHVVDVFTDSMIELNNSTINNNNPYGDYSADLAYIGNGELTSNNTNWGSNATDNDVPEIVATMQYCIENVVDFSCDENSCIANSQESITCLNPLDIDNDGDGLTENQGDLDDRDPTITSN